jgi:hypothetical protein
MMAFPLLSHPKTYTSWRTRARSTVAVGGTSIRQSIHNQLLALRGLRQWPLPPLGIKPG